MAEWENEKVTTEDRGALRMSFINRGTTERHAERVYTTIILICNYKFKRMFGEAPSCHNYFLCYAGFVMNY